MNTETTKQPFNIEDYPKFKKLDKDEVEREYYILPDDVFEEHLKEIPEGTYNKSMTYRAYNGGKLYQIGSDPEKDKEITLAGAAASNATQAQRRTWMEQTNIIMHTKDKNGRTGLENVITAMYERAQAGSEKAAQFLRDTAGEKPVEQLDLNANVITEADQALIDKLKNRAGIE